MEMTGEYRIPAPREKVWAALNDPEILQRAIPGCQSLEKHDDTSFGATVLAKVGPVKATFKGDVHLSELVPPQSYVISGEGKGGAAGFAKGSAHVDLKEDGDATILSYQVNANVGGKLAQIGQRLIDSTAKKMADDFFGTFSQVIAEGSGASEAAAPAAVPSTAEPQTKGLNAWTWIAALIVAVLLLVAIANRLPS